MSMFCIRIILYLYGHFIYFYHFLICSIALLDTQKEMFKSKNVKFIVFRLSNMNILI